MPHVCVVLGGERFHERHWNVQEDKMKIGKMACVLVLFVAAVTLAAYAQQDLQVFVPGNTNGAFGNPIDVAVPLVPAITVSGPGTITVSYVSGTVTDGGGVNTGPNGVVWDCRSGQIQTPIQEGEGVARAVCHHLDALIGVFVPQSRVQDRRGFNPIDGTKNLTRVGIVPSKLFFIGEGLSFDVKEAGTLYLGINDMIMADNGGGFTVEVTGP